MRELAGGGIKKDMVENMLDDVTRNAIHETIKAAIHTQCVEAKIASYTLATADTHTKHRALGFIADELIEHMDEWLEANAKDVAFAKQNGISDAMLDRLTLTKERIEEIAQAVRDVIALPDPTATSDKVIVRPNGIRIEKRRVPLGVIAIIYEARPNVTIDAAALCLKSGNVCILRGGSESIHSNICAERLMQSALKKAGLPWSCISLVHDTSREGANILMHMDEFVDVLIPRGGKGLIRTVAKNASIPVIRTGEGICHIYIDSTADIDMGVEILINGKCQRPSVCNAVECILVHRDKLGAFWKKAIYQMLDRGVQIRADADTLDVIRKISEAGDVAASTTTSSSDKNAIVDAIGEGRVILATDEDWDSEYDDLILAARVVSDIDEAIDFINEHGTSHSECIITNDYTRSQKFLKEVDAAAVYVNASTRFTDGGEFGMGAEIGISTQKLHARGPMGLEELTSYKYCILGEGQVR